MLETGKQMAAFRGISHCYQRPTYADWPYSVFTMAHGRSKEECDAILDSIADGDRHQRARDALLVDRVQEGPDALLHRRLQAVGGGAALTSLAVGHALGRAVPARAARAARRRQLARARDALDRPRPAVHRARRGRRDLRRRRQHLRRLRLLVGPADPRPRPPGRARRRSPTRPRAARRFGAPTAGEVELAELVCARMPGGRHAADDLLGHRGDDERDAARARRDRAREGPQVRRRLPRPRRRPAGRGRVRAGDAGHPRLARACRRPPPPRPSSCRGTTRRRCARRSPSTSSRPRSCEPYPANMGLVPPRAASSSCCASCAPSTARCWSSTR